MAASCRRFFIIERAMLRHAITDASCVYYYYAAFWRHVMMLMRCCCRAFATPSLRY